MTAVTLSGRSRLALAAAFGALALILFGSPARAAGSNDCATSSNSVALVVCHDDRYRAADRKLNLIYAAALTNLQEDQRKLLNQSQLAWIRFRDLNFALAAEMNKDLRSYGSIAVSAFKADLVERRVAELRELLAGPGEMPQWLKQAQLFEP